MSNPAEVVREHLAAVADYDWDGAKRTMSANADLTLDGVTDWEWTIFNLYRQVTQAWDFTVSAVRLSGGDDGVVTGMIRLVNHGWIKDVRCRYQVTQDRIISITLFSSAPAKVSLPLA
ncbi:hypothetical protein [Brevundimonas sp. A19_0]|uniref:hypothetical protein n=1 Tax=Brevundimonas sp. A19_0 TaxID=2821087 RepID=UPI001ADD1DC8|nr:hypothetical protein [Brevundimonas sp. A19_0]MBO9501036.1 hypothetical protein [Brevundimonas sp. A19_0]